VKLLGYMADDDVPVYFQACDVFCMSSVMKTEAFGIVQIEAMSCGKPVVATRIPHSGVSWVNEHGVSGLNAEPCNAEDLAKCIRGVCEDREAYARFSQGALERYRTLFTQEQMIEKCLKIYDKLWL
jgi:rhamnosyl/mannosyltransferase